MERKDLIKLASEAGFGRLLTGDGLPTMWHGADLEALEHFANLVTAAEREACAKLCTEESEIADELGHERFARYSAEMARKIMERSNAELSGPEAALSPEGRARTTC